MRTDRREHCGVRRVCKIAVLCAVLLLVPGVASAQTYWFENYQRAVELIDDGDVEKAAGLLDNLIEKRPLPRDRVRLPGNQFLDYLPYYQRARIEFRLGEHGRASRSLDVSEAFGAIKRNRRALDDLKEIRLRIEKTPVADQQVPLVSMKTERPTR